VVTTFRSDVRAGMLGLLTGFIAANPTMLNAGYSVRPAAFGNRPLGYVGDLNETIVHTQGTRQRTMSPTIVLVWAWNDATETTDIRDDVVDAFLDYATANVHAVSNQTVTSPTGVEDVELEMDGAPYPASIVTFGETLALEGRL
jgi:hypothetical protein